MKNALLMLLMLVAAEATQAGGLELAKQKNCMACHAVDKKVVGPAFRDVAQKYAGDSAALNFLTQRVLSGTGGTWGMVRMPPNPQASPDEAQAIVNWILNQK